MDRRQERRIELRMIKATLVGLRRKVAEIIASRGGTLTRDDLRS
jgi:hypothetical protein